MGVSVFVHVNINELKNREASMGKSMKIDNDLMLQNSARKTMKVSAADKQASVTQVAAAAAAAATSHKDLPGSVQVTDHRRTARATDKSHQASMYARFQRRCQHWMALLRHPGRHCLDDHWQTSTMDYQERTYFLTLISLHTRVICCQLPAAMSASARVNGPKKFLGPGSSMHMPGPKNLNDTNCKI